MNYDFMENEPIDYFRSTKLDESILLDLRLLNDAIYMVLDYAGATFDWMKRKTLQPAGESSQLPNREFRLMVFMKPNRTQLIVESGQSIYNYLDFTLLNKPGLTVIYLTRCWKSEATYHFECMSNKFNHLSFDFSSLLTSTILARPVLVGTHWKYYSIPHGNLVDIHKPFFIDT